MIVIGTESSQIIFFNSSGNEIRATV